MNTLKQVNKTLIFYSMFAILILCVGFIFIGCGSGIGPQEKVVNPNAVQNAIDFTTCSGTFCKEVLIIDAVKAAAFPVDGRPLTVEAWVKVKSASTDGTVTGRIGGAPDDGGLALYIKNNQPKFVIKTGVLSSTEKIVASDTSLFQNIWTHIAGVLSNTVHDDVSDHDTTGFFNPNNCLTGVGAQTPHLDIYVDGSFQGCKTTGSEFAASPNEQFWSVGVNGETGYVVDEAGDAVGGSPPENFNGIIDEVRMWGVERTSAEINDCMNQELGLTGTCNRMSGMVGYMRFNEGQGHSTADWIGLGSGVLEMDSLGAHWETGWTADTPGLPMAD